MAFGVAFGEENTERNLGSRDTTRRDHPKKVCYQGRQAALAVPLGLVGARRERALLELGLREEADLVVRVCGG